MSDFDVTKADVDRVRDLLRARFNVSTTDDDDPLLASYILARQGVHEGTDVVEEKLGSLLYPLTEILTTLTPVMQSLEERERRMGWIFVSPWILLACWLGSILIAVVVASFILR